MSKNKKAYTVDFVDSLKNLGNYELPKETITIINNIDKELNKFFKFLLDKKPYNNKKKYGGDKKFSDSTWRTKQQKRKKLFYKEGEDNEKNKNEREINLLLNKINMKNYETMKNTVIKQYNTEELLEYMVENMFQKAVTQPGFCECYVKLYGDLIEIEDGSKNYLVSNIISQKCDSYLDIFENEEENKSDFGDTESKDSDDDYDKICAMLKQKDYIKGYSQFIGELYKKSIISIEKINLFVDTILKDIEKNKLNKENNNLIEEYISSLYTIIKCLGERFNQIENYQDKKNMFKDYSKDNELTSKSKFKFMDICDLLK